MHISELDFSKEIAIQLAKTMHLVKTEIDSGYGIADIVALKIEIKHVRKRLEYNQIASILSENCFKVLALLSDFETKAKSLQDISKSIAMSDSYLRGRVMKELLSKRFIKEIQGRTYTKVNGWAPLAKEVIAIESKLHDWNRGLTQALRYKTFADKVYLALPEEKIHLVDRTILKHLNVGLVTLSRGSIKWCYHPVKQQRDVVESKKNYVCEYFWEDMKVMATSG